MHRAFIATISRIDAASHGNLVTVLSKYSPFLFDDSAGRGRGVVWPSIQALGA